MHVLPHRRKAFRGGGTPYSTEVLADSPLLYFRLGEASGTTMTDSSGNGHDGTYDSSPTLGASGAVAGDDAVDFNATAYGQCSSTARIPTSGTAAWTLEAWLYPTGTTGSTQWFSQYKAASNNNRLQFGYSATSEVVTSFWGDGGGFSSRSENISETVPKNEWTHVVFVRDGSSLEAYLNGSAATLTSGGSFDARPVLDWGNLVAARGNNSTWSVGLDMFDGRLDEVALYTTALSASRISDHYAARNTA